jgi:hypothetical protein
LESIGAQRTRDGVTGALLGIDLVYILCTRAGFSRAKIFSLLLPEGASMSVLVNDQQGEPEDVMVKDACADELTDQELSAVGGGAFPFIQTA